MSARLFPEDDIVVTGFCTRASKSLILFSNELMLFGVLGEVLGGETLVTRDLLRDVLRRERALLVL